MARDHRFAYVVVIASGPTCGHAGAPVPLEAAFDRELRERLGQVERDLEELDYRRIGLTHYTGHDARRPWMRPMIALPDIGPRSGPSIRTRYSPCKAGYLARALRRCGSSLLTRSWP